MRLNFSSLRVRIFTSLLIVVILCIISSAAFKFSPRSSKSNHPAEDEGDSAEVDLKASASGLERKKADNFRDYVFAKVNNPKLVRPKGKNRRIEDDEENDDDADDDDGGDESEAIYENSDETPDKNRKSRKASKRHNDDDDDDDEDDEEILRVKKQNKKSKAKTNKKEKDDEDDDEDHEEVKQAKKKSKSKKNKNYDDDEEEVKHIPKKDKSKSKKSDDDEDEHKPNKKKSKPKNEDDEDDGDKPQTSELKKKKKKSSTNEASDDDDEKSGHWWNFYGYFNTDKDEEGFLEVIQKKRDEENEKIRLRNELNQKKNKKSNSEEELGKSWLSYLNRKPFNLFYDFESTDDDAADDGQSEDEKHDTLPDKDQVDLKKEKKKSGPLSTEDFEEILAYIPSFVPNYTSIENIDCRRQGQIFHRQLRGQKLWAFQMIDAGGKIGSGILHGNINQLGNFDLCTDISTKIKISEETTVRVKGKYCLAHLDILATDENLKYLMHLINGKSLLRSSINDPSHFVPRFTTFNWGVCVPAACTVDDVQEFLEASLEDYNSTGIRLNIEIDEENCYVAHKFHWDKLMKENYEIVGIMACMSFVLVIVVLATLNQCWTHWRGAKIVIEILDGNTNGEGEQKWEEDMMISLNGSGGEPEPHGLLNSIILKFSLKETWSQLTSVKDGEIECLHGIKAIASIGIFLILKVLQLIRAPYSNRVDLTEILNSPWTIVLRSPLLFMDIFLFLTGLLTTYSLLKRFDETGRFSFVSSIFGKLLRMLPLIALTTLFQAHVWPYLGSGPQWNEIVGTNSELCKDSWWKNLLFVQTADQIVDACDPVSYQFAVQMGLFLIAPVLIWTLNKRPVIGLGLFGAMNAISVAMRFSQTQTDRLAPVFYHGIKMTQIYRTMDMSHGSIIHRATPFMNGLALGFILIHFGNKVKLPKSTKFGLWILSLLGMGWCLISPINVTQRDYVYNGAEMAQFGAWIPLIWSYSLMWFIFACYSGNGKLVNKFLSSKPLVFISRISFTLHFVQYIVLSSVSAKTRAVGHFEVSHFVNTFELAIIVLCSVVLTLTFDLPMQNVRDLLNQWEWKKAEVEVHQGEENKDVQQMEGNDQQTEVTSKLNGKFDKTEALNVNWESNLVEERKNSSSRRESKEENAQVFDHEEEEYEEEEEEEAEHQEGGNSMHEEVDDIWGSED